MKAILVINLPDGEKPEDYEFEYGILRHKPGEFPIYKIALEMGNAELKRIPSEYCVSNKDDQYDNERYFYGYNKAIRDCVGDDNIEY